MNTERKVFRSHEELVVFQLAFDSAMDIYQISRRFPAEEKYSLTDQVRRSSRSVCANWEHPNFAKIKEVRLFASITRE